MSKPTRRSVATQAGRTVKASVSLDAGTHARLCALASLRNMTISAILAEAASEAVRGLVVIDRRKSADRATSDVPVEGSAADSPGLD